IPDSLRGSIATKSKRKRWCDRVYRRPVVAQAFRPAMQPPGSPKGLRYTRGEIMRHLKPINQKAGRVVEHVAAQRQDVVALQTPQARPHLPMGCTFLFSPGWEADQAGGTAGLCTPVERDI